MDEILPSISFVIPAFNSERVLGECLESIRMQDYPKEKIEIIIVDAGSIDRTVEIAKKFGADKILKNSLKTGEAGKAIGVDACKNELVAFVDSDNLLDSKTWLKKMVEPLKNPEIVSSEAMYLTYRKADSFIDRYCALIGMNDPIHLFLGNYDRFNSLTERWTGLSPSSLDKGGYVEVVLDRETIPTMGANGYLVRKEALREITYKPYYFDIDIVYQLVLKGYNRLAMVKVGIIHLFCRDVKMFIRKQKRRITDYLYYRKKGMRIYYHNRFTWRYVKFVCYTLLLFPLLIQAIRGHLKKPDKAWFFHPLACWITLGVYSWGTIQGMLKSQIQDRSEWSQ